MSFFDWLCNCFSSEGKAMKMYRKGMAKAKNRDHQGAIDCYTKATEVSDATSEVIAMVRYNRALVYIATQDTNLAVKDLDTVLCTPDISINLKTMAKSKRDRIDERADKKGRNTG
jgi:hypothetical protein